MTVRDLIIQLLELPLKDEILIGKWDEDSTFNTMEIAKACQYSEGYSTLDTHNLPIQGDLA